MRYILSARVRPGRARSLLRALDDGSFSRGFPYGDLGKVLEAGRVDESGTIRWVEVCYCREAYGVAMEEELPYFERFMSDIVIADARNPKTCDGYPKCNDCDCTRHIRFEGTDVRTHLIDLARIEVSAETSEGRAPRWVGWRGQSTPEEAARNRSFDDAEPRR